MVRLSGLSVVVRCALVFAQGILSSASSQAIPVNSLEDGAADLLGFAGVGQQQQVAALIGDEAKRMLATISHQDNHDKRTFVVELLRMLHEQHGGGVKKTTSGGESQNSINKKDDRVSGGALLSNSAVMGQLLSAIGADGDVRRLIDWIQNSFNLASVGELTTQFVVSKLGSVNCAALIAPDREETLIPRFLLFNEHFVDVPFELSIRPAQSECIENGRFDPLRKTMVLIHGYLAGYTIVDGLTNIKNRLLDLNKLINKRAMRVFKEAENNNATSYLLSEDLELKVRQQQYNVIIVDWFNGANPVPRSNYIRAAVNAQVVGKLIARFLSALVVQCRASASSIQIIAHSLGCHVAGFTGKAMLAAGHRLGKITHLDPIGLCFGRLFSEPRFRLSPQDALDTHAVHVSLNIFDNPLDGAQSNFLVNGGRDQLGCGGQSEVQNSTSSSVSLLWDSEAKFVPCSHVRALSLYEDDLSSEPEQCQIVGYRCNTYERFLAGKCGVCDSQNTQCRLMSLAPISMQFRRISTVPIGGESLQPKSRPIYKLYDDEPVEKGQEGAKNKNHQDSRLVDLVNNISNGSIAWVIEDQELNQQIGKTIAELRPELVVEKRASPKERVDEGELMEASNVKTRSDRRLSVEQRARISQTLDKIRTDTRNALTDSAFRLVEESKFKVSSIIGKSPFGSHHYHHHQLPSLSVVSPAEGLRHLSAIVGSASASGPKLISPDVAPEVGTPVPPPVPLGSQALPAGSTNGPLYFVGTGAVTPYCVNYYQFRLLIAETRLSRLLANEQAGGGVFKEAHISSQNKPPLPATGGGAASDQPRQRQAVLNKDKLHLTIKLTDSNGRFFKGFTLVEDARMLIRAPVEQLHSPSAGGPQRVVPGGTTNMIELTMLLNTTKLEPVRISETIISYYFHSIVLADMVEINYMSNISPEVRSKYSSVLCPIAINDGHHLVRYIECDKIAARKRR